MINLTYKVITYNVEVHMCICFHLLSQSMLLTSAFNPFTFKVIIYIQGNYMHNPITIFLIVLGLLSVGLFYLLFPA